MIPWCLEVILKNWDVPLDWEQGETDLQLEFGTYIRLALSSGRIVPLRKHDNEGGDAQS